MSYTIDEATYDELARKVANLQELTYILSNYADPFKITDIYDQKKAFKLADDYNLLASISGSVVEWVDRLHKDIADIQAKQWQVDKKVAETKVAAHD